MLRLFIGYRSKAWLVDMLAPIQIVAGQVTSYLVNVMLTMMYTCFNNMINKSFESHGLKPGSFAK